MTNYLGARRVASFAIISGWLFALAAGALVLFGLATVTLLPLMGVYGAKLGDGFPAMLCLVLGGILLVICGWSARALFDISDHLQARDPKADA